MAADITPVDISERFRLGVNYWPAGSAMRWWSRFDETIVSEDFARIAEAGMDSVRFFLTWEDFQPNPAVVDAEKLQQLRTVADIAQSVGLRIMPTLFTGHMSGINLIPPWALGGSGGDTRFRIVSGGLVVPIGIASWYEDELIYEAQALLAGQAAAALAGHGALWGWDLGNENSNCVTPPHRESARAWLDLITNAIRTADPNTLITNGLHMEDLEQDRHMGPREVAETCDFLTMHGYPIYATWAHGPTDEHLLPFLSHITRWLGGGRDVLFSEFGLPTYLEGDASQTEQPPAESMLVSEEEAAAYTHRALTALNDAGCTGAMMWCYSDYVPEIWNEPPLDVATHERTFGLWRHDGTPKAVVEVIKNFSGTVRKPAMEQGWINVEPDQFWADPGSELPRLYERYRSELGLSS